ncbi:transcriptional regulator [Streptomyces sp. RKAG337]|uniref:transcriptional regulator n=1 Tax=Streptomyces sp. RKAG337 TaxID=2893404 RepID=UPI0020336271|nr:transcriptional regulator [Streptomyces sp. RKAG337]MCM2427676.1 transcriptional regulator [Streptomyces sp. RKAG337]
MSTDLGRPPRAAENQALVQQRLKEASESGGVRETLTIEWRGQPVHVEVIDMPVEALYFNPGTHRIRAQRSHDSAGDRGLRADPWSLDSQDYLHHLLQALPADPSKRDPDFDILLASLRDFKQNDPGLITRDGIVVNGNTRRAALKELGRPDIRMGVLPESCTWADINTVELSLQLRKDHRRDYSYINRLLAMEEQINLGRTLADIAREFRFRPATCEQDLWILQCLRDLIERSRDGEAQLRLMDFEDDQEKLRELYRKYRNESDINREAAELTKEYRSLAIALGRSKTDVRLIESDFRDRYLEQRLPESLKTEQSITSPVSIPGLGRSVQGAGHKVSDARALTDKVLKAKALQGAGDLMPASRVTEACRTYAAAKDVMESALEPAGRDARFRKKKQAAPDRLNEACLDIEQCITDLVLARASRSLEEEPFDEAILKLRASLRKLAVEAARSIPMPGDGLAWLLDAVRSEG